MVAWLLFRTFLSAVNFKEFSNFSTKPFLRSVYFPQNPNSFVGDLTGLHILYEILDRFVGHLKISHFFMKPSVVSLNTNGSRLLSTKSWMVLHTIISFLFFSKHKLFGVSFNASLTINFFSSNIKQRHQSLSVKIKRLKGDGIGLIQGKNEVYLTNGKVVTVVLRVGI